MSYKSICSSVKSSSLISGLAVITCATTAFAAAVADMQQETRIFDKAVIGGGSGLLIGAIGALVTYAVSDRAGNLLGKFNANSMAGTVALSTTEAAIIAGTVGIPTTVAYMLG